MSRRANRSPIRAWSESQWDKAVTKSFFRTLKTELIHHTKPKSVEITKKEVFEFIGIWCDRGRIHASLGCMTPEK
jgi:transposase InsO family protein